MGEELITGAGNKILDVGVIGAVCLLLIATLIVRERYWSRREERFDEEATTALKEERAAHDVTRASLLEEVRSNGETIALVRRQLDSHQAAFDALVKMRRDN